AYVLLLALFASVGIAKAQRLTGSLSIQLTDPAGKAVADATATITSKDRGNTVTLKSTSEGNIIAADLPPGEYDLVIEHEGFRRTTATFTVRVGVTTSLNFQLEIGAVSTSVMVEINTITVDTDKSTVQGTIQTQQIDQLPLNGRNFLDLAQLAPGVQVVDGGTFDPTKNQFVGVSIGGRSGRSTRIQVDGVDITDETVGTTVMNLSNESIDEFGISQSSLDVSTDLTSTGSINIISKSGTNNIHGSGFGFWRRSDFAANNGPLDELDPPKPFFSRDDYGGRLGGPVIKDKLFWFLAYERQTQTGAVTANEPAFDGFSGSYGVPEDEHMGNARLDYNLTNNHHFFYKYTHDDNFGVTGFGGLNFSAFANKNSANAHVIGWDYTHGNWTHQLRGSYLKFVNGIVDGNPAAGTPQTGFDDVAINITGLNGFIYGPSADAPQATYQRNQQVKYDGSWTHGRHTIRFGVAYNRIDEAGFASFFGLGARARSSYSAGVAAIPFNDNGASDPLNYKFNSAYLGNGLGYGSEKPVLGLPAGGFINNRFGIYAHDTWRVSSTFTLNGGLRYDRDDGLTNHDLMRAPLINSFDPELGGYPKIANFRLGPQLGFAWNVKGDGKTVIRGGGGIYYETNIFNNILFDRTVNLPPGLGNTYLLVGSGFLPFLPNPADGSVLFDFNTMCTNAQPGASNPNSCIGASLGAALPFVSQAEQSFIAASKQLSQGYPQPGVPPQFNIDRGVLGGAIIDPNYKAPYGAQMNIGVQRQLKPGLVFSVDYVLNRGVHFNTQVDRNRIGAANTLNVGYAQDAIAATLADCGVTTVDQAIQNCPNYGGPASIYDFAGFGLGAGPGYDGYAFGGNNINFRQINVLEPVGLSRYQGLQALLSGRLGTWGPFKNATVNATYAYSSFKSSNIDQDFLSGAVNNDNPTQYYGWANEDHRHQFGVSLIVQLPWHFELSTSSYFRTSGPSNVTMSPDGTAADIFTSDLNGDGTVGDPLPGTTRGSFDRNFGVGGLTQVINNFNTKYAGTFTPAGQALVDAGLFTADQLTALGGVISSVAPPDPGQKNNPLFYTTDMRLSWVWKFKERLTVQPMVDVFNIFNKNNTDGPLSGILSGADGTINGTTAYFTRVNPGSGSFSSGQPRAFQFGIRVTF
ncbi:MAG TPA: TonB-dependent receptor, partial [Candidatus Eisenbacteria bacterium]|nr:TonB-dependent receptor [Candidatus Eisenbacteria bacterium]